MVLSHGDFSDSVVLRCEVVKVARKDCLEADLFSAVDGLEDMKNTNRHDEVKHQQ